MDLVVAAPDEATSASALAVLAVFCLSLSIALTAVHIYRDYREFLKLGPGGTPSTWARYLRVKYLGLFALKDRLQPLHLDDNGRLAKGHLIALQGRNRSRPMTKGIAPHRQITQKADSRAFEMLSAAIERLAAASDTLILATSCFEKHGTGMFSTAANWPCRGEICHAHPSDGSLHLTLHAADANLVLRSGWGERHPLARGGWFERFVPQGFVMIYAPQNQEELITVLEIIKAAIAFVEGGVIAMEAHEPPVQD